MLLGRPELETLPTNRKGHNKRVSLVVWLVVALVCLILNLSVKSPLHLSTTHPCSLSLPPTQPPMLAVWFIVPVAVWLAGWYGIFLSLFSVVVVVTRLLFLASVQFQYQDTQFSGCMLCPRQCCLGQLVRFQCLAWWREVPVM